jgi:hypothetical protein
VKLERLKRIEKRSHNLQFKISTRQMNRFLEPELLDELPVDDPRAMQSRRDLRRLNGWMRNTQIMAAELQSVFPNRPPRKLVELGSGDGTFLLRVAQRLGSRWAGVRAALLDRQNIVTPETRENFRKLGWEIEIVSSDVFDWLRLQGSESYDAITANLFLHHFSDAQLTSLFLQAAQNVQAFVAIEPRRWAGSLIFGRLLWLIGCNGVTRHDAIVSIRAGFAGKELSGLWPKNEPWALQERAANFSSHLFVAQRESA